MLDNKIIPLLSWCPLLPFEKKLLDEAAPDVPAEDNEEDEDRTSIVEDLDGSSLGVKC